MSVAIALWALVTVIFVLVGYCVRLSLKLHMSDSRIREYQSQNFTLLLKFQPRFWSNDERTAFEDGLPEWNAAFMALLEARHDV